MNSNDSAFLKQELSSLLLCCLDDSVKFDEDNEKSITAWTLVWAVLRRDNNKSSSYVPNAADVFEALANAHVTQEHYDLVKRILRRFSVSPPRIFADPVDVSLAVKLMAKTDFTKVPQKLATIAGILNIEACPTWFTGNTMQTGISIITAALISNKQDDSVIKLVIHVLKDEN